MTTATPIFSPRTDSLRGRVGPVALLLALVLVIMTLGGRAAQQTVPAGVAAMQMPVAFVVDATDGVWRASLPTAEVVADAGGVAVRLPDGSETRLDFVGGAGTVVGEDRLPGTVSVFVGDDPAAWQTGLVTYGAVTYAGLYPGIDASVSGQAAMDGALVLKTTFTVAVGADPSAIGWRYDDAALALLPNGDLQVTLANGATLIEQAPIAWQTVNGVQRPVDVGFTLVSGVVGFAVGTYDRALPLVIDPNLVYGTYLGTGATDEAFDIAVDGAGSMYLVGFTEGGNLPGSGFRATGGTRNAFLSRFDSGGMLRYTVYLGGGGVDMGLALAVDGGGNAYVAGRTTSTNFPLQGAFSGTAGGGIDGFITKVNPDGSALVYSTYIGGGGDDQVLDIVVDGAGNLYASGRTASNNFPTRGPFQAGRTGEDDAFVLKLNSAGNDLVYSTYLGGNGVDIGAALAVDGGGAAYVGGITSSDNLPTAGTPYQATRRGNFEAWLAKLSPAGNELVFSTYLGGGGDDEINGIAIDAAGQAVVAGSTGSGDFPVTGGSAPQTGYGGGFRDAFLARFSGNGQQLLYSTYWGGNNDDRALDLVLDPDGHAMIAGYTLSENFPVVSPYQATKVTSSPADAFVARISFAGGALYSTFVGGEDDENARAVAVDSNRHVYIAGWTKSVNLPVSGNAAQGTNAAGVDAFILRFDAQSTVVAPTATNTGLVGTLVGTPGGPISTQRPTNTPTVTQTATATATPTITPTPSNTPLATATAGIAPGGGADAPLATNTPTPGGPGTQVALVITTAAPSATPTLLPAEGVGGLALPNSGVLLAVLCVGGILVLGGGGLLAAYFVYERQQAEKRRKAAEARQKRRRRKPTTGPGVTPPSGRPPAGQPPRQPRSRPGPASEPFEPIEPFEPPSDEDDDDDPLRRLRRL